MANTLSPDQLLPQHLSPSPTNQSLFANSQPTFHCPKSVINSAYPFAERSRAMPKQTLPQPSSRIELGALQLLLGRAAAQKQVGRIFCSSSKFSCRRRRRRKLAKLLGLVKACKQVQFSWQREVSSVTLIPGRHSYLATCRCKCGMSPTEAATSLTPSLPACLSLSLSLSLTLGLSLSPPATTSSSSTSDICL